MAKQTLIQKVFAEVINYGGIAATREQAYAHALECCLSALPESEPNRQARAARGADMFAFGMRAKALSAKEAGCLISWDKAVEAGIV